MSRSKLATITTANPYYTSGRASGKPKIFVHHMAGVMSPLQCDKALRSRGVSTHYGIGSDGSIGSFVDEAQTAWAVGSRYWNQRSISIEVSNDGGERTGWHVSDKALQATIKLVADIATRWGYKAVTFTGNTDGVLCAHKWVAGTACPGSYLYSKFNYIATEATKLMQKGGGAMQATYNATDAQLWQIVDAGGGFVKIKNKAGTVLDIKGGSLEPMKNGRTVQAYKDNGTDAQLWRMVESPVGGVRFFAKLDERFCLDVKGGAINKRAQLQIYTAQTAEANQFAQSFYILSVANGGDFKALVSAKSFMVVDSNPTGIKL